MVLSAFGCGYFTWLVGRFGGDCEFRRAVFLALGGVGVV